MDNIENKSENYWSSPSSMFKNQRIGTRINDSSQYRQMVSSMHTCRDIKVEDIFEIYLKLIKISLKICLKSKKTKIYFRNIFLAPNQMGKVLL